MVKTDNHNPKVKLDLRRYFLNKYHADNPPRVFDCCQGGGVMWGTLQKEFSIANYWGVDLKPKKGRLKIDSVRILEQGISENVIDVDTYGEPWKHWLAMLPYIKKPMTVFLTIATIKIGGGGNITNEAKKELGLDRLTRLPQSFYGKLTRHVPGIMLARALDFAKITEAAEAVSAGNARYIGVHLEPINKNGLLTVDAARKPNTCKAVRSNANV